MLSVMLLLLLDGCRDNNTVTDVDGNIYPVVQIGKQVWMAQNLSVTRYRNGDSIPQLIRPGDWAKAREGAYCSYVTRDGILSNYGRLYNGYAVQDERQIAPEGWHIPTAAEIAELADYLKGDTIAGGALKATGLTHWLYPNTGATNSSGFTALPGGYRYGPEGSFHTLGSNGYWWCSTGSFELYSWSQRFYTGFADINRDPQYLAYGFSIRCIKDQ